jgi:PleD family two-component response regulator
LFPRTRIEMAEQVCARIRQAVAGLEVPAGEDVVRVTVSIGVAESNPGDTPAGILRRADVAMFAGKSSHERAT